MEDIISAIGRGEMVIMVDDRDRENEGDLIVAADAVTPEQIGFMLRHTSGIICLPIVGERLDELQRGLHAESLADREAHTYPVDDLGEFRERVGGGGFFRLAWCGSPDCEATLGEGTGATIRVILDGPAPDGPCLVDGAPAEHTVLVARAY